MVNSSTSSSKQRFALKLVVFLALVALLDAGFGSVLRTFYFRQNSGLNRRTTYSLMESTEDIIILGSSRAQANYDPTIFSKVLAGSCFNAGRDGQSLLYSLAVARANLKRHQPRLLVLDLILSDFPVSPHHYDMLYSLLPYYRAQPEVRSIVLMRSPYERFKLFSQIYPFNSLPLQIFKYNRTKPELGNGFIPLHGTLKLPLSERDKSIPAWTRGPMDDRMLASLQELVTRCRESGTELFVSISPVYQGKAWGESAFQPVMEILEKEGVPVRDFRANPEIVNNPQLFRDRGHLNLEGARLYSRLVAEQIREWDTTGR